MFIYYSLIYVDEENIDKCTYFLSAETTAD